MLAVDQDESLDPEVEAMVAEVRREIAAATAQQRVGANAGEPDNWKHLARALPPEVRRLVRTIDLLSLRVQALNHIERKVFGWEERRAGKRVLDTSAARIAWKRACSGERREATIRTVRYLIDDHKQLAQIQKLQDHQCALTLASWQEKPVVSQGTLHTRDVARGTPTFGVRSYPEATPIEVFVLVVQLWMERTGKSRPRVWDLTGGSGTGADVITTVFGGRVISTDIALDNGKTIYGSIRSVGRVSRHGGPVSILETGPDLVVTRPDITFIHPPSRGWPACCWIYGRDRGPLLAQDLGLLVERERYVEAISTAIRAAARRLASDGLVSVLVPEYFRLHQEVLDDPGAADAIVASVADICTVVDRHAVVDDEPVRQASLSRTRGPLEHLILAKKGRT